MATEINGNKNYVRTLYSTKAHVFQIDPITNSSWIQKGAEAIPISFVTNITNDQNKSTKDELLSKRELRIIGIDKDNTVLNATILPKTVFTQKTPKFGQWFDHTKTLYGLGFESPDYMTEFVEKFHHFQREIFKPPDTEQNSIGFTQSDWPIREQLKYENERLKQALEESSMNAVAWNNELSTLRTNNLKLTQALQDSKSHVDEWDRELVSLRDENKELKLKVSALESVNNNNINTEKGSEYQKDLQKYKNYVVEITNKLRTKDDEIKELQRCMEELELKGARQQHSEQARHNDISTTSSQYGVDKQKLDAINAKFVARLSELANVQKEFAQLLNRAIY